jgi:hypothetical protein
MPGNLKNAGRKAEAAIGTTNVDLTRTTPLADPRFQPGKDEETAEPDATPRLAITGKSPNAKIAVPHQRLPDLPPPRQRNVFEATPRKRT